MGVRKMAALVTMLCVVGGSGCSSSGNKSEPQPTASDATGAAERAVPWKRIENGLVPGKTPPLAGEPISLELIADDPAIQGQRYEFIVRIRNTGAKPVSLDPCPAYRTQYLPHVEVGLLNCEEAPGAIPPDKYVDFEMTINVQDLGSPEIEGSYDLLWQFGGEGYEGATVQQKVRLQPS